MSFVFCRMAQHWKKVTLGFTESNLLPRFPVNHVLLDARLRRCEVWGTSVA